MMLNNKIKQLNDNYEGVFRELTHKEVQTYSKVLNTRSSYWYQPYAVNEQTGDIVCEFDSPTVSSSTLFVGKERLSKFLNRNT